MNLSNIDWPAALSDLRKRATTPDARRRLAQSASLAARFAKSFDEGATYALEAARIEPLNPLHRVRFALHCLRFGLHERALATLDALGSANELPAARTVRALATLQSGEDRRAANIARDLFAAHPTLVGAAFLQAEAHLRPQLKEAEARAQTLPRDPAWATAWTHLLVKQIVARPKEAAKVTKQHLEVRPALAKGSAHAELVKKAAAWSAASRDELATTIENVKAGSRAEELVLSLLAEQLRDESTRTDATDAGLRTLHALHSSHKERAAVRRVYVAALTRLAIERAAREEWQGALRAIEVAARLEPHEPVHLQNRAAVLTALADDAQHEAWAELDRLHQRLALAGCLDADTARRIAKPHRMFAEQARLTPGQSTAGVFRVKEEKEDNEVTRSLDVNQARLDDDPEELRQMIHHRRAELVWRHVALGSNPVRVLLGPGDPKSHRARVRALVLSAESLATLVPEEGRALADRLARVFRALPAGRTHYRGTAQPDDATTTALKLQYAETVADLAVIAWSWAVDPKRADIVDELLDTIDATVPFLEHEALKTLLSPDRASELSNVRFLNALIRQTLDAKDGALLLTEGLRRRLAGRLGAELLITLATRRLDATPSLSRPEIERALAIVDRARERDPEYARVEYIAARMLTIGEFYEEARARIERFGKISGKDSPFQQGIEELQRLLDEKKKANAVGNVRSGAAGAVRASTAGTSAGSTTATMGGDDGEGSRVERLEAEIERFPTSVQLYADIARALCQGGRFDVARSWATRAIGRCLTRKAQLRARTLELEIVGLELVARRHFETVEVYLAGSHGAALEAVDATLAELGQLAHRGTPAGSSIHAVHYLRGMCLLARRDRDSAERAFRAALESCTQQLHRAALKPLAENVEQALLEQSRAAVESALAAGKIKDAMREIAMAISDTRAPEACLLDVARVYLAAAVAAVAPPSAGAAAPAPGAAPELPPLPALDPKRAPWAKRLASAVAERSPVARARAIAMLAEELHEPSRKEAAVLLRRIDAFSLELGFAEAIAESTRLERRGDVAAALAVLDGAGERAMTDARALRLRVMLLLRLDRFEDADRTLEIVKAGGHASARSLVDKYPELRFKYGLGAATKLLRANDLDRAQSILVALKPTTPDGDIEWAYSQAFCLARLSYRSLDAGKRSDAIEQAGTAIEILESKLSAPDRDAARRARLTELRDRLDTDLAHMQNRGQP